MRWWVVVAAGLGLVGCGSSEGSPPSPDPAPERAAPREEAAPEPSAPRSRTRLVVLGSGTPFADPERAGPSLAVVVDDVAYLVDAGPGVVRRAAAAAAREPALDVERLERVFLTHLHSDHTLGLPDLMFSPWVLGRREPLTVLGPPGTSAMVAHLREAWREDVAIRTEGLEAADDRGWRAEAIEVAPGEVYRDARVTVRAVEVAHGSWAHAYGYRFDGPDGRVVISGDTRPTDAIVDACDGCAVLAHEVYSTAGFARLPRPVQRYHAAFHTSSAELAALATRARPRTLVLVHPLLFGVTGEALLEEVRAGWSGEVALAEDLTVFGAGGAASD